MIKKERNKYNRVVSLNVKTEDFLEKLKGTCTYQIIDEGVGISEYQVLAVYGQGVIRTYSFFGVEISISDFKLKKDLLLTYKKGYNKLQLSFLLIGEKIISLRDVEKDIVCESGVCYMASIETIDGIVRISSKKPYKELKIRMTPEFLKKMWVENQIAYKKLSDTTLITPITNELFRVLKELTNHNLQGVNRKLFLKIKVLELLVMQMENYVKPAARAAINNRELIGRLYTIRQHVLDNIHENFSARELAKKVGLNDSMLRKEFKRIFGHSISEFSRNIKVNHAKDLLKTTEIPIYQIAEEIGYKNATHFTAAFKKYTGVTPKRFRGFKTP